MTMFVVLAFLALGILVVYVGSRRIPGVNEPGYWSPLDGPPPEGVYVEGGCNEEAAYAVPPTEWWVNVYLVDKTYGGPEEGGWWFTFGELIHSNLCSSHKHARVVATALRIYYAKENDARNSNINSSGSEGCYEVYTETFEGKNFPTTKPHYE